MTNETADDQRIDLGTLADLLSDPETDALADATKNGYLVLPSLNPFLISAYFEKREAQGLPVVYFGSEDWTGPWIVVASFDPNWLRETYEAVVAVGSDVDTSTFHRDSFSASMENCTVRLEEFSKELIAVPEEPASAIQTGSPTGHGAQKCIHRPRKDF